MKYLPARVIEISLVSADGTRDVLIDGTVVGAVNMLSMHPEAAQRMDAGEHMRTMDTLLYALASGLILIDPANEECINLLHAFHAAQHRKRTYSPLVFHQGVDVASYATPHPEDKP